MKLKAIGVASLVVAAFASAATPAQAAPAGVNAGAGASVTADTPTGRFVGGAGTYVVHPHANQGYPMVSFSCTAVASAEAAQTRIAPGGITGALSTKGRPRLPRRMGNPCPGRSR